MSESFTTHLPAGITTSGSEVGTRLNSPLVQKNASLPSGAEEGVIVSARGYNSHTPLPSPLSCEHVTPRRRVCMGEVEGQCEAEGFWAGVGRGLLHLMWPSFCRQQPHPHHLVGGEPVGPKPEGDLERVGSSEMIQGPPGLWIPTPPPSCVRQRHPAVRFKKQRPGTGTL